ncbi:unnamed protein product [Alopecurus aequalis]
MEIDYVIPVSDRKRKFPPGSPHTASAKRAKKPRLRISSVPKDILSSITSKLPLKEAARTSILSRQWRRIWLCRANIDLSCYTLLSQSDREQSWTACGRFIFSELPTTIPHLETLTLHCSQFERGRLPSFLSLRHLILYMTISDLHKRTIDVLDLGCLLEAAPFLEKLELHMVMNCLHKQYCHEDGELRSLSSCPHSHLSLVHITGFIGEKDQLELALHILRNATGLKALKIDPRPIILGSVTRRVRSAERVANGCSVALKFLAKNDHRNVVEVVGAFHLPA